MDGISFIVISLTVPVVDTAAKSDCKELVPNLFQRISPSVVLISAISINPFKLMERFAASMGSGFIFSSKGHILTNSHVVFGRRAIVVTLDDGQTVQAELLGADPLLDLAVLRIPVASKDLPVATMGDSDSLRVGEEVFALGNPFGLGQTLTRRVVSGLNRILPISPMSMTVPMIQTDAAINPGNSGGASHEPLWRIALHIHCMLTKMNG